MADPFYNGDFDPDRSIGYLIKRAAKLGHAGVEASFDAPGLTFSHWVAMAMFRHGIADNCAKLARALGHNSGATTRLVDQLEERGLVERCRDCGDRRVVTVNLTEAGRTQLESLNPMVLDHWNKVLEDFSHDEVNTLISLLQRLVAKLEADAPEGAE
ncbi:MarR family winged helix-turn-helix transcriptional regulator [Glacieibacterium sp.]|uniref:MarR family winged helix-turn-helix transcriptional regulator n=1 Tax=Glacieibacterium sp. TaxID=2860237 RepID=UPI003AFF77C1